MRAQLTRRALLSLVLRLLFLKPVATGNCLRDDQELLKQLQHQADFMMQDTRMLLDHYIRIQGLDVPGLKERCQERPGVFPSEDALQALSRRGFLQTLNAKLSHVLQSLTAFLQDLPSQDLSTAKMYILGVKSNIHCLAQLLPDSAETAEPTQAGLGASRPPTTTSDTFQRKIEGCEFLRGYHRFMHSVGQVFHKWRKNPSKSPRHSSHQALQKGAHGMQPFTRGKGLLPRGQLPR